MIQGKTTFENQWRRRDCCKWGAWANSISIAQELLRRATARATPHTYCIWSCILTRYTSEFQKHRCRTENQSMFAPGTTCPLRRSQPATNSLHQFKSSTCRPHTPTPSWKHAVWGPAILGSSGEGRHAFQTHSIFQPLYLNHLFSLSLSRNLRRVSSMYQALC